MVKPDEMSCVVFGMGGYYEAMFQDIVDEGGMQYCCNRLNNILEQHSWISALHRITTSERLGNRISGFFAQKWMCLEYSSKKCHGTKIVFLFLQYNSLSRNKLFLSHLRKRFPEAKLVFWLTNTLDSHPENIGELCSMYDEIITFNYPDAEKYNLPLYEWCFSDMRSADSVQNDLYFCGYDKHRGNLLVQIYRKLVAVGVKLDFTIVHKEEKTPVIDGIKYVNTPVPYEQVVEGIKNARCILELIPDGDTCSPTLRIAEAIAYSKKLITNNNSVKHSSLYNPEQMRIFSDIGEIESDWIIKNDDSGYSSPSIISPVSMLNRLWNSQFSEVE